MTENKIILNGQKESFDNPRLAICIAEIKRRAKLAGTVKSEALEWNMEIVSENNFPTAAGLASSASGYACLVYTLAQLFKIQDQDVSSIARMGSGSACRSIHGGFVQWKAGQLETGEDSIAVQIAPETHWSEMRILILVVSDHKKSTSSTGGMAQSVKTSELLKYRVAECVPKRTTAMIQAITKKDFPTFGELTMKDSNQFHAVCLDTYPPCKYMNDVSHAISAFVHQYNKFKGEVQLAYTFDAGPNACLYVLEENIPQVIALINHVLPNDLVASVEYIRGIPFESNYNLTPAEIESFEVIGKNLLKYIIYTQVGEGAKKVE